MTEWMLRRLVKGYDGSNAHSLHFEIGRMAGRVGILLNCLLFALKLALGVLSGSIAFIADALNNLTDAAASVITLLGFTMARRPADEHHPYGHARYEYVAGFVVAAMTMVIGAETGVSSVRRILSPGPVALSLPAAGLMLLGAFLKLLMCLFYRSLGRKIGSSALFAAALDSRNDVAATLAVLLGAAVRGFNADGWAGLAVAAFILASGAGLLKETISPLLGRRVDEALLADLEALVLRHEEVLGVHDLLVHDYGPGNYFASAHVEISAALDSQACHDVVDDIECDALSELDVKMVIHCDPVPLDDGEHSRMRAELLRIVREIDPRFEMHDFRLVRGGRRTHLHFDLAVPYALLADKAGIRGRIEEKLDHKHYKTVIRFDGK